MSGPLLWPNLGAEEGSNGPGSPRAAEAVAIGAHAWRLLFEERAHLAGEALAAGGTVESTWPEAAGEWPEAFAESAGRPAFDWLQSYGDDALVPWLATERAEAEAAERGLRFAAPRPAVVARVHDKAFAARACEEERLEARPLRGLRRIFEPDEVRDADRLRSTVAEEVSCWPEWASRRFTLKPRIGTSGRGRLAGEAGTLKADGAELAASAQRLAERGGALLEPWLERVTDLSAQLWIPPPGDSASPVVFAATLVARTSAAGQPRGHSGELDSRGRVFSGTAEEEALRELGATLAGRARDEGYWGPCGIDAVVFELDERRWLQPLELNARFTMGHASAGLVRRALPRFKSDLGLRPGDRHAFEVHFGSHDRSAAFEGAGAELKLALGPRSPDGVTLLGRALPHFEK